MSPKGRSGGNGPPRAEGVAQPESAFDYLWRLRIRSKCGDVSAFRMSGVEDRSNGAFHSGLVSLTSSLWLLLQSLIVQRIGPQPYADVLDEFTSGGGIDLGVRSLRRATPGPEARPRRDIAPAA